ncbi:MAG: N,N'-diacetylchitobiose phosphorylase [Lachnospiraceae bacterium]|nr:N,N'-diacetylchitobiose phosphorylase [Lachnospiraceae bacterium]MDD3660685.1 N,N'-diacetylchitobiose phosphorylase [Lachnospiraceae bacterium]
MQFGYFDNEHKEYVITRPDTPAPWVNYLGSPEYGAIISNNAGGYSFAKSGANGRILRYTFNQFDQPGRYIYLRDNVSKDFWSASWQPVGKDLNQYKSECHHGTSYTNIMADYSDIHSEVKYYVPLGQTYEVWNLKITNCSDRNRNISLTGYAEFTNNNNYEQDQVNLQYSQFITKTVFEENRVRQMIHANLDRLEDGKEIDDKIVFNRFFGLGGSKVHSWCGDREAFLGKYHGYDRPIGVEEGRLAERGNYNGNSCGALMATIELAVGETKEIVFVLGMKEEEEAHAIMKKYHDPACVCTQELEELIRFWHEKLNHFQVKTPCEEFDTMLNTWNAYNCFMTFIWSRAASFTYCGLRNGYGYRDTVQDIQGIIHLAPEMAVEKIRFMLSAQVNHGGGLPLVKFTHNAGHEDTPDDISYAQETGHPAYRADDALWLFPTVYKYVCETGNLDFMDEVIPYANKDSGTVYDHLKRAIDFSRNHLGKHGMPAGLYADWNDCLRLGKEGESTFVALQYYYAMTILKEFATCKKDFEYLEFLNKSQEELGTLIQDLCWDEDRFIRGFTESGEVIGKRSDPEANMWLNPQSWSVISGVASEEQAEHALNNVYEKLNTDYGAILMDPPYHEHAFEGALAVIYNAGTKENAGIFSQSQGWIILAEALKGRGDKAFEYFIENAPSAQNDRAEIRQLEPYCYGQFTEGKASPNFGKSHVHWLTGTASTMMVGCVEGILGMRPDFYGLHIVPAIPKVWDGYEIRKDFRGKKLHIVVKNPDHNASGRGKLIVNGKEVSGNYIHEKDMTAQTEIELIME